MRNMCKKGARNYQEMKHQRIRTVRYGLETVPYCSHQLWSVVPSIIKSLSNANLFKLKIKS